METIYSQRILYIYNNLTNKRLKCGNCKNMYSCKLYNHLCGDSIDIYLSLNKNDKKTISKFFFTGEGCILSQVSAQLLIENLIKSSRVYDIEKWSLKRMLEVLEISPSPSRLNCIELPIQAAKSVLNSVRSSEIAFNK